MLRNLVFLLSLPLFAQDKIPERMIKRLITEQLKQRKASDSSDKALEAIQQFCRGRDQVVVASKDGILLPSRCDPKPQPVPPKVEEKPKDDGAQPPK